MTTEVERKFLLPDVPVILEGLSAQSIQQGYIALVPNGNEVRVRSRDGAYFLTVKSAGHLSRQEVELSIAEEHFQQLWGLASEQTLEKRRYLLTDQGYTVEVDVFVGKLAGLVLAEVEFPSITAANAYHPPAWLGHEVTSDERYKNRNLALVDHFHQLK